MPFCYYSRPLPGMQRFTSQPAHQISRSSEESVAEIARRSGLSLAQVENVLSTTGEYVVEQAMDCRRVEPILGWFGYMPSCGGSHESMDFAPTYANMAIDMRLRVGKVALARMKNLFSAVNVGHNTRVVPKIANVINTTIGQNNTYTPGKPMQVELADGRGLLDPAQAAQGVFFTSASGTKVRASVYAYNKGMNISIIVPTGLTGEQTLSVALLLNKDVRSGIYPNILQFMAATATPETAPPSSGRTSQRNGKSSLKDLALPG